MTIMIHTGSPARPYAEILSESDSCDIFDTIGYNISGSNAVSLRLSSTFLRRADAFEKQ